MIFSDQNEEGLRKKCAGLSFVTGGDGVRLVVEGIPSFFKKRMDNTRLASGK